MIVIDVFLARPKTNLLLIACLALSSYLLVLAAYRLFFSPLSKFPGPRLAALTRWYEFYYDVVLRGQFTFHIEDLHKRYGPIIRITPEELHINDSEFFEELYLRPGRADKYDYMSGRLGNEHSIFTTANHEIHRIRRAPLNPFFSKKRILDFQPVIRTKLDILCRKIAQYQENGRPFPLNRAWTAFAGDVITEYVFGKSYRHLDSPDFAETFEEAFKASAETGHLALQFPFLIPMMKSLPDGLVLRLQPLLHLIIQLQKDFEKKITEIVEGRHEEEKSADHPTIFEELVKSDLPPEEKAVGRLNDEAQLVVAAGLTTTAWAMSVASFHIINNPRIFNKLRKELVQAIPDPTVPVDWLKMEQLPYLCACAREGVRVSHGVTSRNPRVLSKPLNYERWVIPPGTPVSMSTVLLNHNEDVFPNAKSFVPERWLDNPTTKDGSNLERYFISFGKGSRSCLGINLAHAEMEMGLATIFRRFQFELFATDVSDVTLAHDLFLPHAKADSKGVRVKVMSIDMEPLTGPER